MKKCERGKETLKGNFNTKHQPWEEKYLEHVPFKNIQKIKDKRTKQNYWKKKESLRENNAESVVKRMNEIIVWEVIRCYYQLFCNSTLFKNNHISKITNIKIVAIIFCALTMWSLTWKTQFNFLRQPLWE